MSPDDIVPRKYEIVAEGRYVLTRKLSFVDRMLIRFCRTLVEYTPYTISRGSREILEGESDIIENASILVPEMDERAFSQLFDKLLLNSFWCVTGDDPHAAYQELREELGVRFAREDTVEPTITLLFLSTPEEKEAYEHRVELSTAEGTLFITHLEQGPPVHDEPVVPDEED